MITVMANARSASYMSDDVITSGSVGIQVTFMLSADFDGLACIAVFEGSGAKIDVALMNSNTCVVPHEVLAQAGGYLRIGVYASNGEGTIVIPTVWARSRLILSGTTPSEVDPYAPTPGWAAQVQEAAAVSLANSEEAIEIAGGAEAAAADARQSASAAATSATAAKQSASAAGASQTAAEAASGAAASARDAAVAAQSGAESSAQAAAGSATAAAGSAAAAAASEAAAREVKESIPADYTALSEDVSDLKSQTAHIATPEETEADLYICDSDGNVVAKFVDGHIVTKNFDSANVDSDIIADAVQNTADLYICDQSGNVIAEFVNGHIKTKYFDSSSSATGGILRRVDKQIDGVYAACRWHQPTLSSKQFCLLCAGDSHNDSTRMNSMVDCLNSVETFDAGIMLGDMSGNEYTDPITNYMSALANVQKPFLTVLGNHDVVGAASDADLYTKYGDCLDYADLSASELVSGKLYYYKDFSAQKIRVIVLMQYDIKFDGNLCFGQSQIDWFISTLNSTPSGYGVIIAEHTNPSRYMTYNMDAAYTSSTWYQSNYAPTDMSGNPIPDIINAWINGGTLSQTYSYTFDNPPADLTVSADFSARGAGEFITYLGGHWHMDVLGAPTGYTNQPDYHVPAAGLIAATQGDIPRKAGTVSEDSLCAVAVDREKKTVKVFHVGAHYTKDAVNRQYFKYSYGA